MTMRAQDSGTLAKLPTRQGVAAVLWLRGLESSLSRRSYSCYRCDLSYGAAKHRNLTVRGA